MQTSCPLNPRYKSTQIRRTKPRADPIRRFSIGHVSTQRLAVLTAGTARPRCIVLRLGEDQIMQHTWEVATAGAGDDLAYMWEQV